MKISELMTINEANKLESAIIELFKSEIAPETQESRILSGALARLIVMKSPHKPDSSSALAQILEHYLLERQPKLNSICEEHIRYLLAMYVDYLDKNQMPVLTANWLNDYVGESQIALNIIQKALTQRPEWGLAHLVRAKVNLRLGDLTDLLRDLELAEIHGADKKVVTNVRSRYYVETGENPDAQFIKIDDSLNVFLEEELASSWAARRKLHEKLRDFGVRRGENFPTRLTVEESSTLRQLKNWPPISGNSILKTPPGYLLADQLEALRFHEQHAGQFRLILNEQDLLFYREVFFRISKYDYQNLLFDINPFVWLSNLKTNRIDLEKQKRRDWRTLEYEYELYQILLARETDDRYQDKEPEDYEPNDMQWNEETEEWTWWDQT